MTGRILQIVRSWKERWDLLLRPHYPRTALAIEAAGILGLRLARGGRKRREPGAAGGRGPDLVVERYTEALLPEGAWSVSFTRPNVIDPDAVKGAAAGVLRDLGVGAGEPIALLLPDSLARVNLLTFPELPVRRREVLPLIRFRLQKTVPFRMDEAVLAYTVLGSTPDGGSRVLTLILHRNVLDQYEQVLRDLGVRPGLVDLSSLNLLNLCRGTLGPSPPEREDWLLVNLTEEFLTVLVLRGWDILFYRSKGRPWMRSGDGLAAAAALREVRSSLAYYRERLGGPGAARCVLRGTVQPLDPFRRGLEEAAGVPAEILDPFGSMELAPGLGPPDRTLGQRLMPLIGMAQGRRE